MLESKALVVLSGGQDSTTCLAQAIQKYGRENVYALTFDYGQRHSVEVKAAMNIAGMAGISERYEIIAVPNILKGSSPLVNRDQKVESYAGADVLPGGLEKTFVPMRNQLFLTLAANRATLIGLEKGCDMVIITGVSQEDYGGYPDCRSAFIHALTRAIDLSLDDDELPGLTIETPLMYLNKRQTVELAEALPDARELLAYSHTCYNGQVPPCGHCHACLLREKGYAEAGVKDPLLERISSGGFTPEPSDSGPRLGRRFIG